MEGALGPWDDVAVLVELQVTGACRARVLAPALQAAEPGVVGT